MTTNPKSGASFVWGYGKYIGWIVLTAGFITALPLVLEVRELVRVFQALSIYIYIYMYVCIFVIALFVLYIE
jgi:hypothetical protein